MIDQNLTSFVRESNAIEGIRREPTLEELQAAERFLLLDKVSVAALVGFVAACEPGALLRRRKGLDVMVGDHAPPFGGPKIEADLKRILTAANSGVRSPYVIHQVYETLHPFTDCNGRSGRVLWAWQMLRQRPSVGLARGFLHEYYYQSLRASR